MANLFFWPEFTFKGLEIRSFILELRNSEHRHQILMYGMH